MPGICYPRIEQRRSELGTTKTRMAEKLGITVQCLNRKLKGTNEFTANEIKELAVWWSTSADWLMEVNE